MFCNNFFEKIERVRIENVTAFVTNLAKRKDNIKEYYKILCI